MRAVEKGIGQRLCRLSICRLGTDTNQVIGELSSSQFTRMRLELRHPRICPKYIFNRRSADVPTAYFHIGRVLQIKEGLSLRHHAYTMHDTSIDIPFPLFFFSSLPLSLSFPLHFPLSRKRTKIALNLTSSLAINSTDKISRNCSTHRRWPPHTSSTKKSLPKIPKARLHRIVHQSSPQIPNGQAS